MLTAKLKETPETDKETELTEAPKKRIICNFDCFNCIFKDCINNGEFGKTPSNIKISDRADKEKVTKSKNPYYLARREKKLEYGRAYYKANKAKILEKQKAYNQANKIKIAEYQKAYQKDRKQRKEYLTQ